MVSGVSIFNLYNISLNNIFKRWYVTVMVSFFVTGDAAENFSELLEQFWASSSYVHVNVIPLTNTLCREHKAVQT